MSKVSPESGETPPPAAISAPVGLLRAAAELLEVVLGHDRCELGMHSGFPSIGSNVISGWTETGQPTSAERRQFAAYGPYLRPADPLRQFTPTATLDPA